VAKITAPVPVGDMAALSAWSKARADEEIIRVKIDEGPELDGVRPEWTPDGSQSVSSNITWALTDAATSRSSTRKNDQLIVAEPVAVFGDRRCRGPNTFVARRRFAVKYGIRQDTVFAKRTEQQARGSSPS